MSQRDLLANLEGSINLNLNLQGGNVEVSINLEGRINLNRKEFPFSRPDGSVWPQWTSAIFFSCGMQINKTENPSKGASIQKLVWLLFFENPSKSQSTQKLVFFPVNDELKRCKRVGLMSICHLEDDGMVEMCHG